MLIIILIIIILYIYINFIFLNNHSNFFNTYVLRHIRYNTTSKNIISKTSILNPWWVTGFVDAEGSFCMSIFKSKTASIGWTIEPCFIITLHERDLELLNSIKYFFSVGTVSKVGTKGAQFRIRSRSDLNVVISHFDKYPLQTTKSLNFAYFCEILNLINNKVHTNILGFLKLVSLINKLNKPLSESTLSKLLQLGPIPSVEFEISPSINKTENLNPFWISGFATGEGSFTYFTKTRLNSRGKIVKDSSLVFEISQKTLDLRILNLINDYFKIGNVYTDTKGISRYRFRIQNNNTNILISHFNNYSLIGYKALQYSTWIKIVNVLNNQVRTNQRDIEVEKLIKELSNLK